MYEQHLAVCFKDDEFIECVLCKFAGRKITQHVKKEHGLLKQEYEARYGPTICESASKAYAETRNYDWIHRANEEKKDLTEYKRKMAKAVSDAIMNNPDERKRRSELLGYLNKSDEFRKRSSETAKKTSMRFEIQARRVEQLKKWREVNCEEFFEKCTKKMLSIWHSKPEKALYEIVRAIDGYAFRFNQTIKSETFPTKSKRKQVDMGDKVCRVYLEFDGILHFKKKYKKQKLEEIQLKDRLLDEHIERRNWTLIRISYDQWNGKEFKKECLESLFDALKDPQPGVVKIGKAYES